jgi:hypothetical protein
LTVVPVVLLIAGALLLARYVWRRWRGMRHLKLRARRRQAELADTRRRAEALRQRMLQWLDQLEEQNQIPVDWSDFETSSHPDYPGKLFSHREVLRAAQYLQHNGLISSVSAGQAADREIRPRLTTEGHACLTDFGGSVASYRDRGRHVSTTTNTNTTINVTDNHGNMAMANDNVVQNLNMGLDVTEVLNLAGLTRQISQTLGLPNNTREELDSAAEKLHEEAESKSPNKGVMRRMIEGIQRLLGDAPTTAAKTMVVGLAEEALRSITGA